jgi:phage protein D
MTAGSLSSGLPPTEYYVPDFLVTVETQELDPESKGDVLEVKVTMDLKDMTSVEVKFNNYDDRTLALKWSDSELFELGNRIHVQLGYVDRLVSMMQGQITALSPEFPSSGSPTLVVRAHDGMQRLKGSKPPEDRCVYRDLADWQIAQQIADRNKLPIEVTEEGPTHPLVVQRKQDDALFLVERAARIDFDVFMETDRETRREVLYFVKPTDGRDAAAPINVYELEWGLSLIEFTPTITGADQVKSVTVRGWDPVRKEPISYTATAAQTPGVGGAGEGTGPAAANRLAAAEGAGGGKEDVVVDALVMSEEEARRLAEGRLADRSYEYLTGRGRVIGLPDLRPGVNLFLAGLGERFSGRYYVTKATHTLGNSGYTTEFEVRSANGGQE